MGQLSDNIGILDRCFIKPYVGMANVKQWFWFLDMVLWADRVSVRRRLGCSPNYMLTGMHPVLPLDVKEATWLADLPTGVMSKNDLVGFRARALAKDQIHIVKMQSQIDQDKLKWLKAYERDFKVVIKDRMFEPGDLVQVCNTSIESLLDKKMKPRYIYLTYGSCRKK